MNNFYYMTEEHVKAIEKNINLSRSLHDKRETFCTIGTRLVKLILNKKNDDISKIYRLALEIEDVNIQAKEVYWKYKRKKYEQKEKLLKELYELCAKNNVVCGKHNEIGHLTTKILFFELPETEQISWHTNASFVDNVPVYPFLWDGKENSTLNKLEGTISKRYKDDILKSAKRNKRENVEEKLFEIIENYENSYNEFLTKKEFDIQENKKKEKEAMAVCENFVNSEIYKFGTEFLKEPTLLDIGYVITQKGIEYELKYNNSPIGLFENYGNNFDFVCNLKTKRKFLNGVKNHIKTCNEEELLNKLVSFLAGDCLSNYTYEAKNNKIYVSRKTDGELVEKQVGNGREKIGIPEYALYISKCMREFDKNLKKQKKKTKN